MTANELRIGNWVTWDNEPYKVEGIHFDVDNYCYWLGDQAKLESVHSIPLTSEILEKAGGYKAGDYIQISHKLMDLICIQYIRGEAYIEVDGCQCSKSIQYLHQLQNLYFALTGEELNIEL